MAKLKIKKLQMIFLQKDSRAILSELQKFGSTEMNFVSDERLCNVSSRSYASTFEQNLRLAENSLEILDRYKPTSGGVLSMFSGRAELSDDEFLRRSKNFDDLVRIADKVCDSDRAIKEYRNDIQRCEITLSQLGMWEKLDVSLKNSFTSACTLINGTFPYEIDAEGLYRNIIEKTPESLFDITVLSSSKGNTAVSFIIYSRDFETVNTAIRELGFIKPGEFSDLSPAEYSRDLALRIETLKEKIEKEEETILEIAKQKDDIRFLCDYLTIRRDEYNELEKIGMGDSVMVCEGYIPERDIPELENRMADYTVVFEYTDPSDEDDIPTVLKNDSFSEPMESVIEMFSMPGRGDIDPSGIMAFFYYFLFGMMLSDAGYGIIMTLFCAAVLKFSTVEGSMRKMMKMFLWGGISTTFWGIMYGSFFGDIIPVICKNFLGMEKGPSLGVPFFKDTLMLLVFSLGVGICHLLLGLFTSIVISWRQGRRLGGILDNVPTMLLVIGIAPFGASIFIDVNAILTNVGLCIAGVGVVGIILFSARDAKGIFGKIFGGFYALYNSISGYMSDILSYSRLLALGLATGSIAEVINMMGVLPENKTTKAILLVVVFIIGHALNMAINLLGAYVHTVRLQFVELLPKFYEGGGRSMEPFAMNTKYFKIRKEKSSDKKSSR